MPPIIRIALGIYVAALLLFPVVGYFEPAQMPPMSDDAFAIVVVVVLMFVVPFVSLLAFVIYKTYRGRNWARWVLTALTACGALSYVETLLAWFASNPGVAVANAVLALAQLVAVAMLFTAPSNAWYRAQRTQA